MVSEMFCVLRTFSPIHGQDLPLTVDYAIPNHILFTNLDLNADMLAGLHLCLLSAPTLQGGHAASRDLCPFKQIKKERNGELNSRDPRCG